MARHPTILQNEFPYHIGARCINREWFNIPMDDVWEIFSRHLYFSASAYDLAIHLFVLMSNHYHLIASTPESNIDKVMHYFNGNVSRDLTRAGNRINQTFAGRYWKCIIDQPNYFLHAYKYCYLNPVVSGLSAKAEDYKFSTLHGLLGYRHMYIPMAEDQTLFSDTTGTLQWINTKPDENAWSDVREALTHPTFSLRADRSTRQTSTLETARF